LKLLVSSFCPFGEPSTPVVERGRVLAESGVIQFVVLGKIFVGLFVVLGSVFAGLDFSDSLSILLISVFNLLNARICLCSFCFSQLLPLLSGTDDRGHSSVAGTLYDRCGLAVGVVAFDDGGEASSFDNCFSFEMYSCFFLLSTSAPDVSETIVSNDDVLKLEQPIGLLSKRSRSLSCGGLLG
jgi:hypothetical protein